LKIFGELSFWLGGVHGSNGSVPTNKHDTRSSNPSTVPPPKKKKKKRKKNKERKKFLYLHIFISLWQACI
jgi:hypothetical protein